MIRPGMIKPEYRMLPITRKVLCDRMEEEGFVLVFKDEAHWQTTSMCAVRWMVEMAFAINPELAKEVVWENM